MTKQISLTQGYVALVDDDDYEQLNQWKWHCYRCNGRIYAARRVNTKVITMHRFIMQARPAQFVDHADGNPLNNQRSNLRPATVAQNNANKAKPRRSKKPPTSQFKGVYWSEQSHKWCAQIRVSGKGMYIGSFNDEIEAAKAYDAAAHKYFGAFARPNFTEQQ